MPTMLTIDQRKVFKDNDAHSFQLLFTYILRVCFHLGVHCSLIRLNISVVINVI